MFASVFPESRLFPFEQLEHGWIGLPLIVREHSTEVECTVRPGDVLVHAHADVVVRVAADPDLEFARALPATAAIQVQETRVKLQRVEPPPVDPN